jgi:transposase
MGSLRAAQDNLQRFIRWSRLGVFNRIFAELVAGSDTSDRLMIDATHLKAHRTAASLLKRGLYRALSDAVATG